TSTRDFQADLLSFMGFSSWLCLSASCITSLRCSIRRVARALTSGVFASTAGFYKGDARPSPPGPLSHTHSRPPGRGGTSPAVPGSREGHILELLPLPRRAQQDGAALHVAGTGEDPGEEETLPEHRLQEVHVLAGGDTAQEHHGRRRRDVIVESLQMTAHGLDIGRALEVDRRAAQDFGPLRVD